MNYQSIFKRYEIKYKLTPSQKKAVLLAMRYHMQLDSYGRSTIRNIYLDTIDYRLIRRSIEKPAYKEKLRIRSYHRPEKDDKVFVELKKKYDSVVYKRRQALTLAQTEQWLSNHTAFPIVSQIGYEIDYFFDYYKTLRPAVFLTYEREAYFAMDGSDFRVTFDENIQARRNQLALDAELGGRRVLDEHYTLMELKTSGGIPLWMVSVLTEQKIYQTSFSKYGEAYKQQQKGLQLC